VAIAAAHLAPAVAVDFQTIPRPVSIARMVERKRRAGAHVRRGGPPARLDLTAATEQRLRDRLGCVDGAAMHRGGGVAECLVPRIDQHQSAIGEELGQHPGEGLRPAPAGLVVTAQAIQVRHGKRQIAELAGQLVEQVGDRVGQIDVRQRDTLLRRSRQLEAEGLASAARHTADRDLRQVVVFGLQPEYRNHRGALRARELVGDGDRAGRLVEIVERPEKETDLLAGDDGGGSVAQQPQIALAGRARGEASVLCLDGRGDASIEWARGAANGAGARFFVREVFGEEVARAAVAVRLEDGLGHERSARRAEHRPGATSSL